MGRLSVLLTLSLVGARSAVLDAQVAPPAQRDPRWGLVSVDSLNPFVRRAVLYPPIAYPKHGLRLAEYPDLLQGAWIVQGLLLTHGELHETAYFVVRSDPDAPPALLWSGVADAWIIDSHDQRVDLVRSCLYTMSDGSLAYVSFHSAQSGYDARFDQANGIYTLGRYGESMQEALAWSKPPSQSIEDRCRATVREPPAYYNLYH